MKSGAFLVAGQGSAGARGLELVGDGGIGRCGGRCRVGRDGTCGAGRLRARPRCAAGASAPPPLAVTLSRAASVVARTHAMRADEERSRTYPVASTVNSDVTRPFVCDVSSVHT